MHVFFVEIAGILNLEADLTQLCKALIKYINSRIASKIPHIPITPDRESVVLGDDLAKFCFPTIPESLTGTILTINLCRCHDAPPINIQLLMSMQDAMSLLLISPSARLGKA
jgi:hypothetical protein